METRPDQTSNMYPWLYANKSGWMTAETFFKWFEELEAKMRFFTEDGELKKRLIFGAEIESKMLALGTSQEAINALIVFLGE